VEPSLQAAFVDYGGNRHGFLAFSEIHPDYYQIPIADRQALIDEEERAHRDAEAEADRRAGMRRQPARHRAAERHTETVVSAPIDEDVVESGADVAPIEASDARPDAATYPDEGYEPESGAQRHDREPAEHTDSAANDDDPARLDAGAHTDAAAHAEQDRPETAANEFDNRTAIPEHDDAPVHGGAMAGQEERDDAGEIAVTPEQDHDDDAIGQSESAEGDS